MKSIILLHADAERWGAGALLHSAAAFCDRHPHVAAAYLICALAVVIAAIAIFHGGNLKD